MSFIEQPRFTCALGGQQTVLAIPRALPIIHAGPGCSAKITGFSGQCGGKQGEGYGGGANIACTNSCESDVVFGGEGKLRSTIDGALKIMDGDLFVVMSGCTADIVGDDTVGVAKEYAEQGKAVVGVETGGFKGTSYFGHETVVNAIIEQFVGNVKPQTRKGLVNIFSVVPYQNPFWRGDLQTLKFLLESIGLEVNILFGYEAAGISEWKDIPNAQCNLLVSPWAGLSTVKLLEEKYGTPYLHYPIAPMGAQETSAFLRAVTSFAGLDGKKTEAVIQREERRFYSYLESLMEFMVENRNHLPTELYTVADSAYAVGASTFLANEIGFIPSGVYIVDDLPASSMNFVRDTILSRNDEYKDLIYFEPDGGVVQEDILTKVGSSQKALFLGSGYEKLLAQRTRNFCSFISLPLPETVIINKSFVGYGGGLALVEEILSDLYKTKAHFSTNHVASALSPV
jgi:nitrogenase molybdenum-iron protein beta chain